jgi:hypothetical protein
MANAFISVMNRDFHMLIPPIAVAQVALTDPLIFCGFRSGGFCFTGIFTAP